MIMITTITSVICINIVIFITRIWISNNIFWWKQKNIIMISLSMGILSAWFMLAYPFISTRQQYIKTFFDHISYITLWWFIWYIWVIALWQSLFHLSARKTNCISILIFLLIWSLWLVGYHFSLPAQIIIIYCSVYGEETLKYHISSLYWQKWWIFEKDFMLFAILSWLGFCFIENFIYAYQNITQAIWLTFMRWGVNFLLHSIFTWIIAYSILYYQKNIIQWISIWWSISIWLHALYNRSLQNNIIIIPFLFFIGWYFLLSFFLYNTESIYIDPWKELKDLQY